MAYTNSPLVAYTKLSPNHSGQRTHSIDRISPHCVVGQCSVETLGNIFAPTSRQASSNYGIGVDGRVGMYVEEKNRSWCTSSNANDQRAITIEVASDTTEPYAINSKAYNTLIDLMVDICQRNGKTKILWLGDKDKTLAYEPKANEMVITVHRWFANKSCPGTYIYERLGQIADAVNTRLGQTPAPAPDPQPEQPTTPTTGGTIKKDAVVTINSTKATYYDGKTAVPAWVRKKQWIVREVSGDRAVIDKSVDGKNAICSPINTKYLTVVGGSTGSTTPTTGGTFKSYLVKITADVLNVRKGPGTGYGISTQIKDHGVYTIVDQSGNWGKLKSGAGWICLDYAKKV